MARIRSIKPEFFSSLTIARLPLGARLLFIALWTEADDAGRLLDSPKRIAGAAYPHDESIGAPEVAGWLEALSAEGLLARYEADGKRLIQITGWHHQKISHPTESRLPPPPETFRKSSGEVPEPLQKNSVADLGSRILDLGSRIYEAPGAQTHTPRDVSKPIWAQRAEPISAYGPIPDTLEAIMAFEWRGEPLLKHLERAAPDLPKADLWDQAENALNHRGTCADRLFRGWYWPDGCCARMVDWLQNANVKHCNAEAARARLAKTGAYVADTRGR